MASQPITCHHVSTKVAHILYVPNVFSYLFPFFLQYKENYKIYVKLFNLINCTPSILTRLLLIKNSLFHMNIISMHIGDILDWYGQPFELYVEVNNIWCYEVKCIKCKWYKNTLILWTHFLIFGHFVWRDFEDFMFHCKSLDP